MSSSVLKFIPLNEQFIPDLVRQKKAKSILEKKYSCEVEVKNHDELEFIDQGENLEAVICPECRTRNEIDYFKEEDPILSWWQKVEDKIPNQIDKLTMPCCSKTINSKALLFDWPAGFAKFSICLWEPDFSKLAEGKIKPRHFKKLQSILKSKLIQIEAHY